MSKIARKLGIGRSTLYRKLREYGLDEQGSEDDEELLAENGFARVHKSYLVNVNTIVAYNKGKGGNVVLENGKQIMVSPSRKKELLAYFK